MPEHVIQMVEASGCETPADWKFTILTKPQDEYEALLWKAVQNAAALDIGGMVIIANQARAQRQTATIKATGCVKTPQRAKPRRPFRGAKLGTQRKEIDDSKRQQAAFSLMQLAWSWAPDAGPAKGCVDTASEQAQRRFQRGCARLHGSFEAKVLTDVAKVWSELQGYCKQEAIPPEAWPLDHMFVEDFLDQYRGG